MKATHPACRSCARLPDCSQPCRHVRQSVKPKPTEPTEQTEPKTQKLALRIDPETLKTLKGLAATKNTSVSSMIREWIYERVGR